MMKTYVSDVLVHQLLGKEVLIGTGFGSKPEKRVNHH